MRTCAPEGQSRNLEQPVEGPAELVKGIQGHEPVVRRVSTLRRKKQVPGEKSVRALLLGTGVYLSGCESQPNIFPLTPSLGTNENKHLPRSVQYEDTVSERWVGGGGDMRELGRLSLVSVTRWIEPTRWFGEADIFQSCGSPKSTPALHVQ